MLLPQGTAVLACVAGCECEPQEINAHDPSHRVSIEATLVTNVTQGESCLVELRVMEETTSSEHRWKLLGLGIRAPGGATEGGVMTLGGVRRLAPEADVRGAQEEGRGHFLAAATGAPPLLPPPSPPPWDAPCRRNKRCHQPGEVDA